MPLIITLPRNENVLKEVGPYPGALNVLSRGETAVQQMLLRSGLAGYEPMTQATLLALIQRAAPGAVFYDVGAHIGLYSAMISAIYGRKQVEVVAFEPTPRTAQIAREIASANRLGLEVAEVALSAEPGTATLYFSERSESSNSLNPAFRAHHVEVTVPVSTLDAVSSERGVDPYLVKIDVETLEGPVLAGAMEMIERARPWIVCEVLRYKSGCAIEPQLERLRELGYELRPLLWTLPWPISHPREEQDSAGGWHADWIFAPEPIDDQLFEAVRVWRDAIADCSKQTNTLFPPGSTLPVGWNAPFDRSFVRARLRGLKRGWRRVRRLLGRVRRRARRDLRRLRGRS